MSPCRLGIRWKWQWNTVCPAAAPTFRPMLKPSIFGSCSVRTSLALRRRSLHARSSSTLNSKKSLAWRRGIISPCCGHTGNASQIANARAFRRETGLAAVRRICARLSAAPVLVAGHPRARVRFCLACERMPRKSRYPCASRLIGQVPPSPQDTKSCQIPI